MGSLYPVIVKTINRKSLSEKDALKLFNRIQKELLGVGAPLNDNLARRLASSITGKKLER